MIGITDTKSMDTKTFFIQLILISLAVGLGLYFLNGLPQIQEHSTLSWASLAFFIVLSILMYFVGKRTGQSENKNDFTNVVLGFTMGKMFISAMLIYIYIQLIQPEGKLFILPFFGMRHAPALLPQHRGRRLRHRARGADEGGLGFI